MIKFILTVSITGYHSTMWCQTILLTFLWHLLPVATLYIFVHTTSLQPGSSALADWGGIQVNIWGLIYMTHTPTAFVVVHSSLFMMLCLFLHLAAQEICHLHLMLHASSPSLFQWVALKNFVMWCYCLVFSTCVISMSTFYSLAKLQLAPGLPFSIGPHSSFCQNHFTPRSVGMNTLI